MIEKSDATLIANASADLIAEYGGNIDPRAMLWTNLLVTLAGVYGPRTLRYLARRNMEAQAEAEKARANGRQQTTATAFG